ncbi:MAG: hypothetical protein HN509_04170 [Halobacteriovoraceae bacterium]|jgi:hypothetical protein|nr:hypothetical protein [Halobacteriovoraceae bacterium]MBT5093770.1 hypothetical protein [Halobacteriovoraceae bacterium]
MKKWPFILLLFLLGIQNSYSLVGVGGYVPFGLATQSTHTGDRNTLNAVPTIAVNAAIPFNYFIFSNHVILPEIGRAFHGTKQDGYEKNTTYFLLDLGWLVYPSVVLRYGFGTFVTQIKGKGGVQTLGNGSSFRDFEQASRSSKSWNSTINGGIEFSFMSNYAARFETFIFSPISGARNLSYIFSMNYYL